MDRATRYPRHLAKLVAERLRGKHGKSPTEAVLTRLLETLYFASLKTDEGRRVFCTVDYVDLAAVDSASRAGSRSDRWNYVRFPCPLPFDVRTLAKISRAADPEVSSLAVFSNRKNQLFISGMVDQEPRYGEALLMETPDGRERPRLFQATIVGPGSISVFHNGVLVGSLVQNALVQEHHNVLWSGPIHAILKKHLAWFLANESRCQESLCLYEPEAAESDVSREAIPFDEDPLHDAMLLRWLNSLCRILVNIQRDRHGGGLVIVPDETVRDVHIKYELTYDRLPRAITGLVRHQHELGATSTLSGEELRIFYEEMEHHKNELLGTIRFIASLAGVDGVVLMDRMLAVRGFGVELRADHRLDDVLLAGDVSGSPDRMRKVDPTQFGTRHRAMIRYCHERIGTLGFVVSQDGDIQAMTRIGDKLVLWENIDVPLAFPGEDQVAGGQVRTRVLRRYIARLG